MRFLGIDVGTTAVKVALFDEQGALIAGSQSEHQELHPAPGMAELDPTAVWGHVKDCIRQVMSESTEAEIGALSISSMGEAVVPVTKDRKILGPSILIYDARGSEFLPEMEPLFTPEFLYPLNGNTFGNQYSLTKIKWIQTHQPQLYQEAAVFLHWRGFIAFMLGAEPAVDYSLANRTLLFDLNAGTWSEDLIRRAGLDKEKLPHCVPSGTIIGRVNDGLAAELGLPKNVKIISGAHDQCANAVGCGVMESGNAVYGMGTYLCITPVFSERIPAELMFPRGLNTEHHAVPGQYVSFLYNQGGALVKWFRNTFAATEHQAARKQGKDIYPALFNELPEGPSSVFVLPHFTQTGPPTFTSNSSGVITGLHLDTTRGDILKGIVEGTAFYLKQLVDSLPETGLTIQQFYAAGGGSQSDTWVQLSADIFGKPFTRPCVTQAGAVGAAIIAGVGLGYFSNFQEAAGAMVKFDRVFEPDRGRMEHYQERLSLFQQLAPCLKNFLQQE